MTVSGSANAMQLMAGGELSLRSRVGHVALLLAALGMTIVVSSLWVTEPVQPARLQLGFAVMVAIGVAWAAFATWVLTHRRPLFARHRIIAGRMAVTFTSVFIAGMLAVGYGLGRPAFYGAAAVGLVMLAAAAFLLARAHRAFAALAERRAALERELGKVGKRP